MVLDYHDPISVGHTQATITDTYTFWATTLPNLQPSR